MTAYLKAKICCALEVDIIAILYLLIGLIASVFGALAGLGGGIIIKPVLDLLGQYDVSTIGILSASTVFSMSMVSLINSVRQDIQIKLKISMMIALSSITGGIIGKVVFNYTVEMINNSDLVTLIQAAIIAGLMVLIFIFVKYKHVLKTYELTNPVIIIGVGFVLGVLAAFLGIGGGPFNVAILTLLFSMKPKQAGLNSIFIIFFSQLSSIVYTASTTGFSKFDLSMLPYMIAGGVIGGLVGSNLVAKIEERTVDKIFLVGIVVIIGISVVNVGRYFV